MNSSSDKTDYTFKILTIGESGVGKTCLLLRYTDNKFIKNYLTTIGIDFKVKLISIHGKSVKLKIWDTAGQERFRNITQQYYKGSDGIVLVYDVTDRESFEKISDWMKQITLYTQTDRIGIVLLGNKVDLEPRQVKAEEGAAIAQQYGIKHFETSAFTNLNVEESFKFLTEEIMSKKNIEVVKEGGENLKLEKKDLDQGKVKKKGGCC
jgi:small GTP-binding protein